MTEGTNKIKIGILDSGLDYKHPDLVNNVCRGVNLVFDPQKSMDAMDEMDDQGHGTQMAGIIGAMHNDFGVDGINPNIQMCGIKVFNQDGKAYLSDIISGIEWSIENKMNMINMSFGTYENSTLLKQVIEKARNAGIILIASAGNSYSNDLMYPAEYQEVIGVGAHGKTHRISRFSNWHDDIFIYAPGEAIQTTNISNKDQPYVTAGGYIFGRCLCYRYHFFSC